MAWEHMAVLLEGGQGQETDQSPIRSPAPMRCCCSWENGQGQGPWRGAGASVLEDGFMGGEGHLWRRGCVLGLLTPHILSEPLLSRVPLRPRQPQEREDRGLVLLPQEGEDVPVLRTTHGEGAEFLLGGAVRGGPEHAVRGHGALQPAAAAHHRAVYVMGLAAPPPQPPLGCSLGLLSHHHDLGTP